jgi:hypothetical protein
MKTITSYFLCNKQNVLHYIFLGTFLFGLLGLSLLSSCSNIKISDIDKNFLYSGTPFKSADDSNWGMVSNDGHIIFSDEFDRLPTRVTNERFLVKDKDSLWTYYNAEKKPKRIGKHYVYATDFSQNGYAIASEIDDCITIINKSGEIVWKADKVVGRQVDAMSEFNNEGLAWFSCGQNYGVINSVGNIVLQPNYCKVLLGTTGDQILAIDNKYQLAYNSKNYKDVVISIFNENGKGIGNFSLCKYVDISAPYDKLIVAYEKLNEDTICGLIDQRGDWVVKANKDISKIIDCKFNVFIYYDGDKYGLKRINGEDLIRAKYDFLKFADDGLLWAYSINDDVVNCKLIDFSDQQIGNDTYKDGTVFNNGYAIVQIGDNDWAFINHKGEDIHKASNISLLKFNVAPKCAFSNFLDVKDFVNALKIKSTTLNDMSLDFQIPQALAIAYCKNDSAETGNKISNKKEDYIWKSEIKFSNLLHGVFYDSMFLYEYPGITTENININRPVAVGINIPYILNANGKLTRIFKQMDKIIREFGHVVKSNKNATIISGDGLNYELIMAGNYIQLNYFKKNYLKLKDIDIDIYQDIKERNSLKLDFPKDSNADMYDDSVAIDSAAIDY